jgi:hypothetical protein
MVCDSTKWVQQMRELLIIDFGSRCNNPKCMGTHKLEFAHKKETKLSGRGGGRGSYNRVIDVMMNPDCYILLCQKCHDLFDSGKLILDIE